MKLNEEQLAVVNRHTDAYRINRERRVAYLEKHCTIKGDVFSMCSTVSKRSNDSRGYCSFLDEEPVFTPVDRDTFIRRIPFYFFQVPMGGHKRSGLSKVIPLKKGSKNGMPILRWTSLKIENPADVSFTAQKSRAGELRIQLGPLTTIRSLEPSEAEDEITWEWVQVYAGPQTMLFDYEALKEFRLMSGMTQKAVADAIGAAVRTYQKWEKGESTPDGHYLLRIMNWLNIDSVQQLTKYLEVSEDAT